MEGKGVLYEKVKNEVKQQGSLYFAFTQGTYGVVVSYDAIYS